MPRSMWLDEKVLGYLVHTNRELGLMLRGIKPLAVFSAWDGEFVDSVRRYLRMFDRYVEAGIFLRRDHVEVYSKGNAHVVLFARLDQAWRIDEMIALRRDLTVWNAEHERTEGELLGYEDWQNDIWIAERFGRG